MPNDFEKENAILSLNGLYQYACFEVHRINKDTQDEIQRNAEAKSLDKILTSISDAIEVFKKRKTK